MPDASTSAATDPALHPAFSPWLRVACLLAAMLLVSEIFHLGSAPGVAGLVPAPWDKVAHFALYSTLTALLWIGTAGRIELGVFLFVVAIGALDELQQVALPGRSADGWDFLTDAGAALAALFVLRWLFHASRQAIHDIADSS